jgi:hypothetical protein
MKAFSKANILFTSALMLLHLAFFLLALHFKRIYMGDTYEYVYMALNIRDNGLFYAGNASLPLLAKNFTLRPPGYSLALLPIYLFTVNNWVVILLQNVLSVCNIIYTRNTLSRLGYNTKYDRLFLLLIVAYPAQFIYANTIAPDLLLQTCVLLYFGSFVRLTQRKRMGFVWIMNLALTYGIFTKPILLLFIPVHVLIMLWLCFGSGIPRIALLSLLIPIGTILAYNTWNLQRTGKFHFTSIQPWNGMYYNVRMFQEHRLGMREAGKFMEEEQKRWDQTNSFKEWYDYGNQRSLEFLKEHFLPYMAYHTKYSLQFFIHPGKGEIDLFTGELTYGRFFAKKDKRIAEILKDMPPSQWAGYFRNHPSVIAMLVILCFNLAKVCGAIAFFISRQIHWQHRLLLFVLLGYFAFMTGPLANTRYHLPVSLLFIGCSTLGYQWLLQRRKTK